MGQARPVRRPCWPGCAKARGGPSTALGEDAVIAPAEPARHSGESQAPLGKQRKKVPDGNKGVSQFCLL